ncbi:ABC transporter ATP-binding protein [Amylibacter sp. SFDW26]|uniref:energy-coupling factor ABC transporter ATP-binding protein n=1 Tax=Amylibacter sp. SFDW26 TaxID=2652722 RepID=UPI00126264A3|nr:ABC transporter ATP-binding protein [Amylibacter sp. SFDW26]KAB7616321.1 ABC transporter ATP-binding protein [Amylibacter sp. SFDW26]
MTVIFKDVEYRPQGIHVLGPVTVELSERRIGIVGRNGSGKSSFSRLLAGLVTSDVGKVMVNNVDVVKDRNAALSTVGIIFQNPDHQIIFPTVGEEIEFGLQQLGMSRERAAEKAELTLSYHNRAHWYDRSTHTLSQGQRHFLCLMSVLAMEPKTIVLDEPYAGLDIPTSLQLHRWLETLDQQIIMITHDPEKLKYFDRVLWLEKGQIVGDGLAGDVLQDFSAEMVKLGEQDASADPTA